MKFNIKDLNLGYAFGWALIWMIVLLFLARCPFYKAVASGIAFFVWYVIFNVILKLICEDGRKCFFKKE
tara:strand:+ start:172 stop:378 length:207 start_codon:yes stop_codon:yes gene_type:complete